MFQEEYYSEDHRGYILDGHVFHTTEDAIRYLVDYAKLNEEEARSYCDFLLMGKRSTREPCL